MLSITGTTGSSRVGGFFGERKMGRVVGMLVLLLSPGLIAVASAQAAQASITGLWKVECNIMGQPVGMMCALTETNHRLSGTCTGAQDGYVAHKIAGTVKAQKVEFYFQAAWGGNSLTTIVSGVLNEDRTGLDGDMDIKPTGGDMGAQNAGYNGSLSAIKEPEYNAATVANAVAAQTDAKAAQAWAAEVQADLANGDSAATNNESARTGTQAAAGKSTGVASPAPMVATGTWKIDGTVMGNAVTMTCVLTEAEHALTGTCSGAGESRTPRALTGTATANSVGWRFDDEYQGQPITFSMNATLAGEGRKMSGTMALAPFGVQGTFCRRLEADLARSCLN